jgi:hypothetical protein
MTSTDRGTGPWPMSAPTLFNPYVNLGRVSTAVREQTVETPAFTGKRPSRTSSKRLVAREFAVRRAADSMLSTTMTRPTRADVPADVTMYVQQMIHNQFVGRSGTPSDMRYEESDAPPGRNTATSRSTATRRTAISPNRSRGETHDERRTRPTVAFV